MEGWNFFCKIHFSIGRFMRWFGCYSAKCDPRSIWPGNVSTHNKRQSDWGQIKAIPAIWGFVLGIYICRFEDCMGGRLLIYLPKEAISQVLRQSTQLSDKICTPELFVFGFIPFHVGGVSEGSSCSFSRQDTMKWASAFRLALCFTLLPLQICRPA